MTGLPLGVFSTGSGPPRVGAALGDQIIDLTGTFDGLFDEGSLDAFLAAGIDTWSRLAAELPAIAGRAQHLSKALATMHLPCRIGDYVDFYSSLWHAMNVGRLFRPGTDPLTPNWRHLPIGYHGRSGTIVVDGTPIKRPRGQRGLDDFGPSQRLDFELEVGFITGNGPEGPIPAQEAERYIFGLVLVNDWSARDIQSWEYQPLGPFLGKLFATTISPWVVPLSALKSFRIDPLEQDPPPLPYLTPAGKSINLELEVSLNGQVIARSNFRNLYWTMSQQLAHATSNGATVKAGDLFASGTISGPEPGSFGCLLEITENGANGNYLEDGDEVVLRSDLLGTCAGKVVG
ncbi:MAG TPA: fumarylacetoacetate hydrolase family protein [Acidimicrobiia bacterium]|nr:fumarylacetoacetate hydrolase family protein [Acidimicrobiia bacterium]